MAELKNIPCNVITGFLGSGKTTAILHLLKQKPEDERWAVLVNEFGRMGIDGSVIATQNAYVKEIPGGCMCCSAGVPMQVALNDLIKQSRPQRLLIEPTGIGHPRQIIKQLSSPPFDQLLDMRACITLLDPRQLQDSRYRENELFNDQIAIADVLAANKTDQCKEQDQAYFLDYLQGLQPPKAASGWLVQGQLDIQWLDLPHAAGGRPIDFKAARFTPLDSRQPPRADAGFQSWSQEYDAGQIFDYQAILALISQLKAERIKALLKTDQGDLFINSLTGSSSVMQLESLPHSRIEVIQPGPIDKKSLSAQLKACILNS